MTSSAPAVPGSSRSWTGAVLVLCLLGYALAIHHGVGPVPQGGARAWYEPRGWLLDLLAATTLGALLDGPVRGLVGLTAPALALAVTVFLVSRSAIGRTLAVASLLAVMLFLFYGLGERSAIWQFFRWRGSAVMVGLALITSATLCAPLLAASWLRLGWPARIAVYTPAVAASLLALRDITGTDPKLPFAISPWPVVTMFGMEIGATLIAGGFALLALPLAIVARLGVRSPLGWAAAVAAIVAAGLAIAGGSLPRPGQGLALLALVGGGTAFALLHIARTLPGSRAGAPLGGLAAATSLGSLLVALPLSLGLSLVERDYHATRDGTARTVIDALATWFAREGTYPDSLEELVAAKDLVEVPAPVVGFGVAESAQFVYQNFGTSYILEFAAPRWVQCAYNPPWAEEDADEEEAAEQADADEPAGDRAEPEAGAETQDPAHGAWSCPSKPPELW